MKAPLKCLRTALVFSVAAAVSLVCIPFAAPKVSADAAAPEVGCAYTIEDFDANTAAWNGAGADTTYTWGFTTDPAGLNPRTGGARAEIIQGVENGALNADAVSYWIRDQMNAGANIWDGVRLWLKSGCGQDVAVNIGFQFDDYSNGAENSAFDGKRIQTSVTATTQGGWVYFDLAAMGLPLRAFKYVTNFRLQIPSIGSFNPRSGFVLYMDDFEGYCKAGPGYTLKATDASTSVSGGTKTTSSTSGVSYIGFIPSAAADTLTMQPALKYGSKYFFAFVPAGTYTVLLHTYDSNNKGSYTVAVNGSAVGPVDCHADGGTPVAAAHTAGNVTLADGFPVFQFTPSGGTPALGLYSVELVPVTAAGTAYETALSVADGVASLVVTIRNPAEGHTYQIWSYDDLGSDVPGAQGDAHQWVLQKAADDDQNPFTITGATPDKDGSYRIMVLDFGADGNVVSSSYESDVLTPDDLNVAKIRRVLVNGRTADGVQAVNASGGSAADVSIKIDAVNAAPSGYSLSCSADGGAGTPVTVGADGTASVDFRNFAAHPGTYTFTAGAKGLNGSADTRTVVFKVYSAAAVEYPVIGGMTARMDGSAANRVDLTLSGLTAPGADTFHYSFAAGEPGRPMTVRSNVLENLTDSASLPLPQGKYGVWAVFGYVGRSLSSLDDDSVLRYVEYKRPEGGVKVDGVTVSGSGTPGTGLSQTATVGETCTLKANVTANLGAEAVQYSFWRCDASGWVLLKAWSKDAGADTLTWQPAYAGNYIIQVRVKGENAGSYEDSKDVSFTVGYPEGASKAVAGGSVTLKVNGAAVTDGATLSGAARTPVTLGASVGNPGAGDHLLYRYDVSDANLGNVILRAYSPDSACTWVPRKAGAYQVSVKIINQNSFGMYDQVSTRTVTVD